MYNIILHLSRNIFFYKKIILPDTYQTRINLMLFHFSIILLNFKKKNIKFEQEQYDFFFRNIEYNLRELGFGDVSVNSKMKDLNKILYDILLKIEEKNNTSVKNFELNEKIIFKYFETIKSLQKPRINEFKIYFETFFNFCFEQSPKSMLKELKNFKY